jgi:hypothetical protein
MHPRKPDALLEASGGIPALIAQARRLLELRKLLFELLPDAIARSCSIANYKNGKVVIFSANGAVAAKLKLLRAKLCNQLAQRGVEVTGMDIVVQPPERLSAPQQKRSSLSAQAADDLRRLSDQLPDSELKRAISRLAARG